MITFTQAVNGQEFHEDHEPAGKIYTWRRNGATQTWKTRPGQFRIPVKYGLRSYGQIHHYDAGRFHLASECPTRHVRVSLDGTEFDGIVLAQNHPVGPTVLNVQVTRRGTSKHRVGSRPNVPAEAVSDL